MCSSDLKEDIRILSAIIHILDGSIGLPVLSEDVIDFGSDLADFLKEHIFKIMAGDDCKKCEFYQEQSEIFQMLQTYDDSQFVVMSQNVANLLYDIMNSNIDIPAADLAIVRFRHHQEEFLAILKMNYKSSYVHQTKTMEDEDGEISVNDVIKYKTILPSQTQRLQEAAIINLHTIDRKSVV